MIERKSAARFGALVFAVVLAIAASGCQKRITGTIPVKGEKEIAFAEMAKIAMVDAINGAVQSYPGKAIKAELKNRDGFLVYSIEIVSQDNTLMELTVDAGNGNILVKEPGRGERD